MYLLTLEENPNEGAYAVADIAAVGDNVLLRWTGSSWALVSTSGGGTRAAQAGTGVAVA